MLIFRGVFQRKAYVLFYSYGQQETEHITFIFELLGYAPRGGLGDLSLDVVDFSFGGGNRASKEHQWDLRPPTLHTTAMADNANCSGTASQIHRVLVLLPNKGDWGATITWCIVKYYSCAIGFSCISQSNIFRCLANFMYQSMSGPVLGLSGLNMNSRLFDSSEGQS